MRRWGCVIALCGLAALSRPAVADDTGAPPGRSAFRGFDGSAGLHNRVIKSIAQDGNGQLWVAADDGVYRFDGEQQKHYTTRDGLRATVTTALAAGPDGAMCAGSDNGLACWDGTRFSQVGARGLPDQPVATLMRSGGALWAGTKTGLYVRTADSTFAPAPGWPGAPTTSVRALWVDDEGIVVGNGASVELSTGDGAWSSLGDVGLGDDVVEGVLRDREGALWIRTSAHLWFLPRGAQRATDLRAGLAANYDSARSPASMVIGPRGNVLLATDQGISHRDGDRWRTLGASQGLPDAGVTTLFVDREGSLWIGSAGLLQLRGRGIVERYTAGDGLLGDTVWTYARDPRGVLFAGTNGCLARADEDRWNCVPGTEGRVVTSIAFSPHGGMFVGGAPSDLLYISADGVTTSIGEFDRPDHNILAMAVGPEGDLWIGRADGLYRVRGAVPGVVERIDLPGAAADLRIPSVITAGKQVWASAAPGGVFVLDHGTWRAFGARDGFRFPSVNQLTARRDGRICSTYTSALGVSCFRYDGRSLTSFEHLDTTTGLTTDMVNAIGEDRAHRLWIGTDHGIDVATADGVDHLDENDGIAGNDSAAGAFLLDRDGSVWLGATTGATHIFAQHYLGPPRPPRTALLDGRLGDQAIALGYRPSTTPSLEVPHDRGALALSCAADSLADASRVEYQQRLSPVETEWTTTRQRHVRYPSLQPGAYRFEARARVDGGAWGPISDLQLTVLPAWWQTRWFYGAVACTVLVAAGAFAWRQRTAVRRRTRQLHAQSDESFRAVVDLIPDLVVVVRGERTYLNVATRQMLGLDPERGTGTLTDLVERVHPDDRAQVLALLAAVPPQGTGADRGMSPGGSAAEWQRGAIELSELRFRGGDGSWRICEISALHVVISGTLTLVASGRDITERKRMRAKLLISDRMASLGTLAAGIAHEINNPLAYVAGNLEVIAETLQDPAIAPVAIGRTDLHAAVHDARDGAERVRKILLGLRTFSRADHDQRVPLALPEILEAAIRLTDNEVRHRAQLVRELEPIPRVVGDDGQLTQVFLNLLANAAHAIPEGSSDRNQITLRTRTDAQGSAVVEIEDTGKGMAPDVQARVFDPFFTTKAIGEGTGLGLSICHGIVTALGGQITVESPPERRATGTLVRVVLPAAPSPAAPPASATDAPAAAASPRRHRVMLVDDEPMVANTIGRLLHRDYDVTVASCGQDALDHITGGARFDAIVSDVMMPNMTGVELIEALQRLAPDQAQRLIFLSGGAFTEQTRARLAQIGAPQLEKPITARELRAWVLRVASHGTASILRAGDPLTAEHAR